MVSQDKRKKNHDDPNSNWRYGGVARRDFRASKDGPEAPKHVRKKTKKDKLVCKQSPDKVHHFVYIDETPEWWPIQYNWGWTSYRCDYCGKMNY